MILGAAITAAAGTLTFDTNDRGYYYSYDYSDSTNKNYLTGQINIGSTADGFNSFFEFNGLTGLTGPIVSATLNLFNPSGGYSSAQTSETLTIDEFSGDTGVLDAGGTVTGEYAALDSGTVFGTATVSAADDGSFVTITLNANGIAFLNANGSNPFAFGGYLAGIDPADTSTRFVFGGSSYVIANDDNTSLTVVTGASAAPEPGTWVLAGFGFAGLLVVRRRMQQV